jgi:hypothetical protein
MDLDAPKNPTPEELASYERYKRWQDRIWLDTRPRLSQRTFSNCVQSPLTLASVACFWWGRDGHSPELVLLGITLGLLPLLVRKIFRIRRAPDA